MSERTEQRVWVKHALRRTMCKFRVCKLLNCNRCASVEKTCRVVIESHNCCTRTIFGQLMIDNKKEIINVTIEWE